MREITISGESICSAPYCSQFSLVEGSICSICFTVFVVPALQCISVSSVIVCTAYCTLCTMQHPSSSCCISLSALLQNGRPTSLSLKLQAGREKTRAFIGKGGRGDLPLFLGHLLAHTFLGTLSNLDWCFYFWFWSLTDAFTFDFEATNIVLKYFGECFYWIGPCIIIWVSIPNKEPPQKLKKISVICLYFPLRWAHLFQTLIEVSVVFGLRPSFY